ncbi:MAG: hypothetical protein FWE92_01290 [Defluviitaleaceae bacterium]|nr:hypothetical protein [Defluviitaleaceae bacterium]
MDVMTLVIVLIILAICTLPTIFYMRNVNRNGGTDWRKQKVFDIIVAHRVFTVAEISKLSGISEKKLIPTLRFIVSEANASRNGIEQNLSLGGVEIHRILGQTSFLGDVGFLRGSRLDLNKMEIVLAENSSVESTKQKWICLYCDSKNPGEAFACGGCGTRRQT